MALLSRLAENVYWAARYLERAEDTARVLREHTNLLVDVPSHVISTWEPLLAINGSRVDFDALYPVADERNIVRFLVADRENPSSILSSIDRARENLRTTRAVLPREVWEAVNDLFLLVAQQLTDGVARRTRQLFCNRVISQTQLAIGIIDCTMSRDHAFTFIRLGMNIERADMTTRVLDVRAGTLIGPRATTGPTYDEVQWLSVLRSLSALQAYHRTMRRPVDGSATLRFCLHDGAFPRSVARCLSELEDSLRGLPGSGDAVDACTAARALLASAPVEDLVTPSTDGPNRLTAFVDQLEQAVAIVHQEIEQTYFGTWS